MSKFRWWFDLVGANQSPAKDAPPPALPPQARWSRSLQKVDLEASFLFLQLDLREEIKRCVAEGNFKRADSLESALLSVIRAAKEIQVD